MKKHKIIMIEGARNTGKTFLTNSLKLGLNTYKFPFAQYFNESFSSGLTAEEKVKLNSNKELYFLTLGYDITILDLMKKGFIKEDLVVDRGILSNIIFGIQSNRITMEEGLRAWEWLCQEYGEFFEIAYVHCALNKDRRNKDMWDLYDQETTMGLYDEFMSKSGSFMYPFENKFNTESVDGFNEMIGALLIRQSSWNDITEEN